MENLNNYTSRIGYVRSKNLLLGLWRYAIVLVGILLISHNLFAQGGKSPAASLEQIRNGSATKPIDPAQWQNGNAGNQTAHYVEGHSIGYRALLTNLPSNTSVELTMAYDIRHSSKNAIDFLTHFDRLQPHGQFTLGGNHPNQEVVDPRLGTSFVGQLPTSEYLIPRPLVNNENDVPGTAYDKVRAEALDDLKAKMTMWGGTITDIQYDGSASLTVAQSEQRIKVFFTTGSSGSAVLAWGGHIASRLDWGYENGVPLSAGGISGSPYHMRLKDWTLGNLGNQDRSLAAAAVIPPPGCALTGPTSVCAGSENTYSTSEIADSYAWTLEDNTSGATFKTAPTTTSMSVVVIAGSDAGTYTVKLVTTRNGIVSTDLCEVPVTVSKAEKPAFTIQDATICGTVTTPSITICNPEVGGTYVLKQPNQTNKTINYVSGPAVFSGVIPGIGFTLEFTNSAGCKADDATCDDVSEVCPTSSSSNLQGASSTSSLKGIEDIKERDLTAYPVPFSERATVEYRAERSGNYVINLYDIKGTLIKQLKAGSLVAGELQKLEVDGTGMPEGMYLIRVESAQGAKTLKLLKKE